MADFHASNATKLASTGHVAPSDGTRSPLPVDEGQPQRQRSASVSDVVKGTIYRPTVPTSFERPNTASSQQSVQSDVDTRSTALLSAEGGPPGVFRRDSGHSTRLDILANRSPASRSNRPSSVPIPPTFGHRAQPSPSRTLDSYSSRNVAAALGTGGDLKQTNDVWQSLCVKVLPLFNGEGYRGYIEDLNDLVRTYIQRTFDRCGSSERTSKDRIPSTNLSILVSGLITSDLTELVSIGCLTFSTELAPAPPSPPLEDEKFMMRLTSIWKFFWSSILPDLEAIFWVLRADGRLKGGHEQQSQGIKSAVKQIDIRRLALIGFRDSLILPQIERIASLFKAKYASQAPPRSSLSSNSAFHQLPSPISFQAEFITTRKEQPTVNPSNISPAEMELTNTRRQMVAVLAGVLTADERQSDMDHLLRIFHGRSGEQLTSLRPGDGRESSRAVSHSYTQERTERELSDQHALNVGGSSDEHAYSDDGTSNIPSTFRPTPANDQPIPLALPRLRATTLDSLDEDAESYLSSLREDGTRPSGDVHTKNRLARRNFLPILHRSNPPDSVSTSAASTVKTMSGTTPQAVPLQSKHADLTGEKRKYTEVLRKRRQSEA